MLLNFTSYLIAKWRRRICATPTGKLRSPAVPLLS
jgi:hypothetical protein